MKEQNKPILWILGIVLAVLLLTQTNLFTAKTTYSAMPTCSNGDVKCCDWANMFCSDVSGGTLRFTCTDNGWYGFESNVTNCQSHFNNTYYNNCVNQRQTNTCGQDKCGASYDKCSSGYTCVNVNDSASKCTILSPCGNGQTKSCLNNGVTGIQTCSNTGVWGTCVIPQNNENTNTETNTNTTENKITIPIINIQVTTTQAAIGGVSLLFLIFLFL